MNNVFRFYILANRLKDKMRAGWVEIGIKKERIESVAEHIYGTLILAISINDEYELGLDMEKVLKMMTLHELEEILMPDYTIRSNITKEEKLEQGKKCVSEVVKGLINERELIELLDEFNAHITKESLFCFHIDKIECDFQAKLYDLYGVYPDDIVEKEKKYYGNAAEEIASKAKNPSDSWIEYDMPKYDDDELFKKMIREIKDLTQNDLKNIPDALYKDGVSNE